jgi:hypothetical protein
MSLASVFNQVDLYFKLTPEKLYICRKRGTKIIFSPPSIILIFQMKLAWEGIKGWGTAKPSPNPSLWAFYALILIIKGRGYKSFSPRSCYKYGSPPESVPLDCHSTYSP